MAAQTIILVVALCTLEAVPVNVLLVAEDDVHPGHVAKLGLIDLPIRLRDLRVRLSHDVVFGTRLRRTACWSSSNLRLVACLTPRHIAPLPVAAQALPVVGTLEAGFPQVRPTR